MEAFAHSDDRWQRLPEVLGNLLLRAARLRAEGKRARRIARLDTALRKVGIEKDEYLAALRVHGEALQRWMRDELVERFTLAVPEVYASLLTAATNQGDLPSSGVTAARLYLQRYDPDLVERAELDLTVARLLQLAEGDRR